MATGETSSSSNAHLGGRRSFLKHSAAAGAALVAGNELLAQVGAAGAPILRFGVIGCGAQSEALRTASLMVPGIRFAAVADIQLRARRALAARIRGSKLGLGPVGECKMYERAEEMLEKENLDAVIVAVPDFLHKRYTNLSLEAGVHVYCEKPMASTLEDARAMVRAQIATGKLLQIGHQRRSNAAYLHALNRVVRGGRPLLGWVTQLEAQWNRSVVSSMPRPVPYKLKWAPTDELLQEFGFGKGAAGHWNLANWRMVAGLGSGMLGDLGAHQIDVLNWFMGTAPRWVSGSGFNYHTPGKLKRHLGEWLAEKKDVFDPPEMHQQFAAFNPSYDFPDHVRAMYGYEIPPEQWKTQLPDGGTCRSMGSYKVASSSGADGFYEQFSGERGQLRISEDDRQTLVIAEPGTGLDWKELEEGKDPVLLKAEPDERGRATWRLPVRLQEPPHSAHLRNFYQTIVDGGTQKDLNCPAVEGFRTEVTILKTAEAVARGERIEIKAADLQI